MRCIAALAVCLVVTATARADDWDVHRDAFDPAVVQRYKAVLARDPHDAGALRQLVALYGKYRTAGKLEAEYRAQLASGEDWATLVVLARLPRPSRPETLALWTRALAARPDDARGWLAAGDATTDAKAARDAYRRAAALVTTPAQKRIALTKLVAAARNAVDADTVDAAYTELIALAPKDGTLWLERGTAQLAAKHFAPAIESFATAESLLGTEPDRRLSAMTSHAIALEGLGRADDAIAEYEHALDKVPAGYYLGEELVLRIVEAERKRRQLAAAIARLEKRWPAKARGYFAWATLGDLYHETHDDGRALDAYQHAVTVAPTEVATQRKLIALLDKLRPGDALAQHEAAARVAPGDADLQLELAKRYYPAQTAKALATLERLAHRMSGNVSVRSAIAALYEQWNEPRRAIGEYEAIAAIEPREPDHAVALGEAYWRAENPTKARAVWERLDAIGTPVALFRHGEVLALHEAWDAAAAAYTRSLALDGKNVDAWYGRARANDELGRFPDAIDDARRAVALTASATQADGLRNRLLLVRVLRHAESTGLVAALARWRFAFEHGDPAAGYLLAAHHARLGDPQLHEVLVKLYRLVPTDDSLGIALARSFVHRGDYGRAHQELARIAQRRPARAAEIGDLIAQVDKDRERSEREIRWQEEGSSPGADLPDLVGRDHRVGMRLELGGDVRAASSALLGLGLYETYRVARGVAFVARLDWTKRNVEMTEINAVALAGGIAIRIADARKLELAAGIGPRVELRYGYDTASSPWNRAALAGDVTLEVLPRALPLTLALRYDQVFTDAARSSALLVELGVEVR